MARSADWIRDLLILDFEDMVDKWGREAPKNEASLLQLRKYYRNKKGVSVERTPNNPEGKLVSTWESITKNAEGEAEIHQLHKYEYGSERNLIIKPVEAAKIPPDRRKPPKRDHKLIFVFSDAQIGYRNIDGELNPIHDEAAITAALKLAYHLRPNVVVDCGDTTDFGELGKFSPDSDHFYGTLQPSLQRTHELFAQFSAATPGAERVTVWSNHVKRLTDYILRNAPALYNIKAANEKYPAMSYPGLLKLDEIGWGYADGYPGEYQYAQDLAFMHGTFAVSNGSTANKLSKANYGRNVVQGHKHSIETHYHTTREGNAMGAFVVGALCRIDGAVPSYHNSVGVNNQPVHHMENWQNGVMVIRDYGDGKYQFDQVPIRDGVIFYNGEEFNGHE